MENKICGYDGFKIFIPGEALIDYLVQHSKEFNLLGRYSVHDNHQHQLPLSGHYGNEYKIRLCATKYHDLGRGVEVTGSFHKFYNNGENHSIYYWHQFLETVNRLVALLPFKPQEAFLINLEVGLNIQIPGAWSTSAKDIIRSIQTYKGITKNRMDIDHKAEGYFLQFGLTEYFLKIYDKSMQYGLSEENILRFEMKIKKSSFLKDRSITVLSDIMLPENHQLLANELSKLFKHLVIYQDEVNDLLLLTEEKVFAREYNRPIAWDRLHDQSAQRYKYVKKKLEELINEVCQLSYKKELQELIFTATQMPSTCY